MSEVKMSNGPKKTDSSLSDWFDALSEASQRAQEERERIQAERCEFLCNYFRENPARIQDLGKERALLWKEDHREVVLNSRIADEVLTNDKALDALWEEIARRSGFDHYLLNLLGMEVLSDDETEA